MIAERLTAQLLAGEPARDPVSVAVRLLAIQGQDPRGARLAIRSRTTGVSARDVDRALSEDRTLVITWLNRGTLHLVRSEDFHWLHSLTAPGLLASSARRLAQEGISPATAERALKTIESSLASEGPLTRHQLRERIAAKGVPSEGQALPHLLFLAAMRGLIVRGPVIAREHAYVLARDWLGEPPAIDRDRALTELARRYLIGHGPAGERDLAKWSGLPLRDVRTGLRAIAGELVTREDGLLDLARRAPAAELPPPRLLGAFDPLLLGWHSREPILRAYRHRDVVTVNGIFRPFALVRGRVVATWTMTAGKVVVKPFGRLSRRDTSALAADAEDVVGYLDARNQTPGIGALDEGV
jgi:hypothetical protein